MIFAGLLLLAVGALDLVRQFAPRRWIGYLVVLALIIALGGIGAAIPAMIAAPIVGVLWLWSMPDGGRTRASFWPAVVLAIVCVLAVVLLGERADAGWIGGVWDVASPFGPISYDLAVLVCGVIAFLLESGNVVVRTALAGEHTWRPDGAGSGFQGGRLIGPLERVIVFLLTITVAYPLLAAMLAAKGIVRFPEISKDGETGARAEYFLVGSLVSWVMGLGGAFLVWWAANV